MECRLAVLQKEVYGHQNQIKQQQIQQQILQQKIQQKILQLLIQLHHKILNHKNKKNLPKHLQRKLFLNIRRVNKNQKEFLINVKINIIDLITSTLIMKNQILYLSLLLFHKCYKMECHSLVHKIHFVL